MVLARQRLQEDSRTVFLALIIFFYKMSNFSKYGDTKSARNIMLVELKKLIEANPLFRDKLAFPAFKSC
ncbi:protein TPR2-like [Gossypium australe]|uniref:Protein TPR2-like n=1 Tax=Gossypium australe TaxID=47621 RepID=A0A5B6VI07_9ROSI|nr:protein TPR2-like [Gossypium australe]